MDQPQRRRATPKGKKTKDTSNLTPSRPPFLPNEVTTPAQLDNLIDAALNTTNGQFEQNFNPNLFYPSHTYEEVPPSTSGSPPQGDLTYTALKPKSTMTSKATQYSLTTVEPTYPTYTNMNSQPATTNAIPTTSTATNSIYDNATTNSSPLRRNVREPSHVLLTPNSGIPLTAQPTIPNPMQIISTPVIQFIRGHHLALRPSYDSPITSSGFTVRNLHTTIIPEHGTGRLKTGLIIKLPDGYYAQLSPHPTLLKYALQLRPQRIDPYDHSRLTLTVDNFNDHNISVIQGEKVALVHLLPLFAYSLVEQNPEPESTSDDSEYSSLTSCHKRDPRLSKRRRPIHRTDQLPSTSRTNY